MTYRTGNHWGVTIVREAVPSDPAHEWHGGGPCEECPRDAELVAVVVNGDRELARRICELLNDGPCFHPVTGPIPEGAPGCDRCEYLRREVSFWREQQTLAATVASDLSDLNDHDGQVALLRRKLAEERDRRQAAERQVDVLTHRLEAGASHDARSCTGNVRGDAERVGDLEQARERRARGELAVSEPCPTCQGASRETTNMICRTCLTSYSPESWAWWTIAGDELMKMLYRVQNGDEPGIVYAEAYANSDHEDYRG